MMREPVEGPYLPKLLAIYQKRTKFRSIRKMATECEVEYSYFFRLMKGKRLDPSRMTLWKISKAVAETLINLKGIDITEQQEMNQKLIIFNKLDEAAKNDFIERIADLELKESERIDRRKVRVVSDETWDEE